MSIMLQEIAEQPLALEKTISAEAEKYRALKKRLADREISFVMIVARGSSDNASLFGRYLIEISCGIPVSLCAPSVFTLYGAKVNLSNALVVGVSQSGEGTDINTVLEAAQASGALTLAITNEADSSMAKIADEVMLIHAGREKSVAATKTYSGQMIHFYMLAEALGGRSLPYHQIPSSVEATLGLEAQISELVGCYQDMTRCVVMGRGLNYGNSYELSLKLMETCYVVAERFSSADFFHGPLAIIEQAFPAILFGPPGPTKKGTLELLAKLSELKATTMAITSDDEIAAAASVALRLPGDIDEFLTPIPYIVPGQLFAGHLAKAKGIDADAPRSLSKVTKTL
jgi:glucosamine--fructose-6-phosphate aminotransferase (isomerizing)